MAQKWQTKSLRTPHVYKKKFYEKKNERLIIEFEKKTFRSLKKTAKMKKKF